MEAETMKAAFFILPALFLVAYLGFILQVVAVTKYNRRRIKL
jgi:hypothetical protein